MRIRQALRIGAESGMARTIVAKCLRSWLSREPREGEELTSIPLFTGLDRRSLERVARRADHAAFGMGKVLVHAGQRPQEVLFLRSGTARVNLDDGVGHLSAGDVVNAHACLKDRPQAATVVAETSVSLWIIERRAFSYLSDHIPELRRRCSALGDSQAWGCPSACAARPQSDGPGRLDRRATLNPT